MPDDLGKKGPTDKKWVNVNESREVSWWASALLTTEEKLKTAVKTESPTLCRAKSGRQACGWSSLLSAYADNDISRSTSPIASMLMLAITGPPC